jgi:hypothetical protein
MSPLFQDRHPGLKTGTRTVLAGLLAVPLSTHRIRSLRGGSTIVGPLAAADGEYVYFRCHGSLYKCHVDEFVEHSRLM